MVASHFERPARRPIVNAARVVALGFLLAACAPRPTVTADVAPRGVAPPPRPAPPRIVVVLMSGAVTAEKGAAFQPLLCTIDGRLETGAACGEAMPARATVATSRGTYDLSRSTQDFVDEASERTFVAPRAPACCMYNTCVGETLPYSAGVVEVPPRTLAVWPTSALAEITLHEATHRDPVHVDLAVDQSLTLRGRAIATGRQKGGCRSCATFLVETGHGFHAPAGLGMGADGYQVLASSDLDGDGSPEAIVFEEWRNDYGLFVLGNEWQKPLYRFNCGNI